MSSVASKDQPAPASSQRILCAATSREFLRLEHQDGGALAEDESAALEIEWPGGAQRFRIPCLRKCTETTERGDQHFADHGFGATGQHALGLAQTHKVICLADGVATGGAGAVNAGVGAAHL